MLANKFVPKLETSKQVDYLKLASLLAAVISLFAIFRFAQLSQSLRNDFLQNPQELLLETNSNKNEHNPGNATNKTKSFLRVNVGFNQTSKSLLRSRRSLPFQKDEEIHAARLGHNQLEAFEGLVIPVEAETVRTRDGLDSALDDAASAESEHQPFLATLYRASAPREHQPINANHFRPTYYSMSLGHQDINNEAINEADQQQHQAVANLMEDEPSINMVPSVVDELVQNIHPRKINTRSKGQQQKQEAQVDIPHQVPESFDNLVKDESLPMDMMAHHSNEPLAFNQVDSAAAQGNNYHKAPKMVEIQPGNRHMVPILSNDLNAAAGHYYGKKKHKIFVKKKIIFVKTKKKKVIHVKKVKKKKKKHHGGGHHHHDHGKYYMYAKVPKKKSWEFGFKRGNKKHWVERHEKGHKNKFKTQVKWYDAKSKGKGHHVWDYNHHDKKKKKHHG